MKIPQLIQELKIDFTHVRNILNRYDEDDWKQYVSVNSETYNKTKVFRNDSFEIFVITWNLDQKADIHNHPRNCYMKLLRGKLIENIYNETHDEILKTNVILENEISFMNEKGVHSITNIGTGVSASLHIYSPPNFKTEFFGLKK